MSDKDLTPLWAAILGPVGAAMLSIPTVFSFPDAKNYVSGGLEISGALFIGMSFANLAFYFFRLLRYARGGEY